MTFFRRNDQICDGYANLHQHTRSGEHPRQAGINATIGAMFASSSAPLKDLCFGKSGTETRFSLLRFGGPEIHFRVFGSRGIHELVFLAAEGSLIFGLLT